MWFVFAAASALCFGLRGILYQWTSQRPIDRNLLLFGVYLSGTLIVLGANGFAGQAWTQAAWIGVLLGLFSFMGNASMYKGYAVGRASLVALLTAMPPVVVVAAAYFLWNEKLNAAQLASFLVIIAGLLLIRYSSDISFRNLKGVQWGALAMLSFGLTDLTTKQATLLGAETLPVLSMMFATGSLLFGASWLAGRAKTSPARVTARETAAAEDSTDSGAAAAASRAPVPWSAGRTVVWGMVVGLTNVCGMMFVMPAFREGVTGLVSAIIAMNVVFVLLYARFVLKETFSRRETAGLVCTVAGVILLRLAA